MSDGLGVGEDGDGGGEDAGPVGPVVLHHGGVDPDPALQASRGAPLGTGRTVSQTSDTIT